jgi:tetratricopeptide (TPR) repeat protein
MTEDVDIECGDSNTEGGAGDSDSKDVNMKTGKETRSGRRISKRRLWLFRFIAVVMIPAIVLLGLELILRVVGYGYSASALKKIELKGEPAYCNNYQFGWRFWPRTISRESEPYVFTAAKGRDTYRIFILGGSAALGTPEPAYSFSRCLDVMLEQQYPQCDFEVINTAITAINSHVVLLIAQDCAPCEGDLFIVYLGNNEVIGPYGAGTIFAPLSDSMFFVRMDKAMQTMRLGQFLKNTLKGRQDGKAVPNEWGGSKLFMENLIRRDSANLDVVYDHYKRNLEDITRTIQRRGAEVILCSVGSNIKDNAPFASLHRSDITDDEKEKWESLYAAGVEFQESGDTKEALESYLSAAKIDDTYADLRFRTARIYWQLGSFEKARQEYIIAREYDALRLRADNRINQSVYEVVQNNKGKGVYFVDSVRAFEEHSPHNTPGEELFLEHVHMNFKGNYILAKTVFEQVEAILPESLKGKRAEGPMVTEDECSRSLVFADWDRYKATEKLLNQFIKKPPFTSRLYNDDLVESLVQDLKSLEVYCDKKYLAKAQQSYLDAIENNPADPWLRRRYARFLKEGLKSLPDAAEQYQVLTELLPGFYQAHAEHGLALMNMGDFDSSIASCKKALQINPTFTDAIHVMGISYSQKGNTQKAIECFSRETHLRPDKPDGYNRMGVILDKQGKVSEAEAVYRRGLRFCPDDKALHYNLAFLLAKNGRLDEAAECLGAGLKFHAGSPELMMLLNKVNQARMDKR